MKKNCLKRIKLANSTSKIVVFKPGCIDWFIKAHRHYWLFIRISGYRDNGYVIKKSRHRQWLYMHGSVMFVMHVSLPDPRCPLTPISVSVNVKDAVVIHHQRGGMTRFVTVVMDSVSLRGTCASGVSEKLSLCFTLATSNTQTHPDTLLKLTTKNCLSNCAGRRLRFQEKELIRLMLASCTLVRTTVCVMRKNRELDQRCCLRNNTHKTLSMMLTCL